MRNIIDAICEIVQNPMYELMDYSTSHNRAVATGEALEEYIKDIFAGSVGVTNQAERNRLISESFSYLGNQSNPPDSMLIGGDAIEVKKIESNDSSLALNSSYPKAKLYSNSSMISKSCRNCEEWSERDMIYIVGVVNNNNLKSLAMVYGTDYCAEECTYEVVKSRIKEGVESIPNVEFSETKELGRINRVDPLGITYLRVRGMWGIENPFKVFNYIYERDHTKAFNLMCIINREKFISFDNSNKLYKLASVVSDLHIDDIMIKKPNNPAQLIDAISITFCI